MVVQIDSIITGIEKIISIIDNETKIIPGYGLLSNLDELQDYLHMLKVKTKIETLVKINLSRGNNQKRYNI